MTSRRPMLIEWKPGIAWTCWYGRYAKRSSRLNDATWKGYMTWFEAMARAGCAEANTRFHADSRAGKRPKLPNGTGLVRAIQSVEWVVGNPTIMLTDEATLEALGAALLMTFVVRDDDDGPGAYAELQGGVIARALPGMLRFYGRYTIDQAKTAYLQLSVEGLASALVVEPEGVVEL